MKRSIAILFMGMLLARGLSVAEELESFLAVSRPVPLEFVKPPAPHPALERHYGDPSARNTVSNIRVAFTDGAHVFAHPEHYRVERTLAIWRIEDAAGNLKLEGDVGIGENWRVSPDGKYLFGRAPINVPRGDHWSMYHTDTWTGSWQLDRDKCPSIGGVAFSPDGKSMAVLADLPRRDGHIIVLDLETGKTLALIKLGRGVGSSNKEGRLIYVRDAILVAPAFDDGGRITRVNLADWKVEKVPLPKNGKVDAINQMGIVTSSSDEKWLILHNDTSYAVLQHAGRDYTLQFEGAVEQPGIPGLIRSLETVAVSPDSRQLVVSGAGQHKVFDLTTRKVVHADDSFCRCGIFSKDGRIFWRTCAPFEPIDTTTWESVKGWEPHGHLTRINGLAFSPDGRWLVSCDDLKMFVWPTSGSDPVAECASPKRLTYFQSPEWSRDGGRIIGADGWDFLTWKWAPVAAAGPRVSLQAATVFGAATKGLTHPKLMHLSGNSTWTAFLTQMDKGLDTTSIRYPQKPGVTRHFKLPANLRIGIVAHQSHFTASDKEVVFTFNGIHAYNVETDALRSQTGNAYSGKLAAYDRASRSAILRTNSTITLVDDATLQSRATIKAPLGATFANPRSNVEIHEATAVTLDGRWLALCGAVRQPERASLILLDLKQAQVSVVLPLEQKEFTAAAFTPDGKKLALGHLNGSISLWDVDKLIATAPADAFANRAAKPKTTVTPMPAAPSAEPVKALPPLRWQADALPREPIPMAYGKDSTTWQVQPDGALGAPEILPYAGKLYVNGQPPVLTRVQVAPPLSSFYTYDAVVEATAVSGAVHITRHMKLTWAGDGYLTDFIENVTPSPLEVDVDAEMISALPLNQLQDNKKQPLSLKGSECALSANARGVWGVRPSGDKNAFFGVSFALGNGSPMTRILADSASRRLRARYHLSLPPYDRRIIGHLVNIGTTSRESEVQNQINKVASSGRLGNLWMDPALLLHAVNFAPVVASDKPSKSAAPNARLLVAQPSSLGYHARYVKQDGLGFQWTDATPPCGFGTELGCRSGLEVWIDGAPATFVQERADAHTNTARISQREWSNASGTINLLRVEDVLAGRGTFIQELEVENHSDTPRQCRIELVSVLSGPVTALYDAEGRPLAMTAPIPPAVYHGIVAIETAGADHPVTILALGKEGGTLPPPVLTLVNQRVLIARYELTVGPREIIPLYHAATQRPLKAFPSFSEVLAGWEPKAALPYPMSSPPRNWPSG